MSLSQTDPQHLIKGEQNRTTAATFKRKRDANDDSNDGSGDDSHALIAAEPSSKKSTLNKGVSGLRGYVTCDDCGTLIQRRNFGKHQRVSCPPMKKS
jgi:hypothetical protein